MDLEHAFDSLKRLYNDQVKSYNFVIIPEYGLSFEEAPNEIVFIKSDKFLNLGLDLFPIQYAIIRDFFELLCPNCNDIERIKKEDDVPISEQILFEYHICPKCGLKKSNIYTNLHHYNELIAVMGMRSGKSMLAACISAAFLHKLLCIKDLQTQLGIIKNQTIDISFVATTASQAYKNVFGQFKNLYKKSPWFNKLKNDLISLEQSKYCKNDLYIENKNEIHFKHAELRILSLHSNSDSLAGSTRILTIIDELARFDDAAYSKRSAIEVYRVLKNSLLTIDSAVKRAQEHGVHNLPNVSMICISSPMSKDDKIMSLLKEARENPRKYSIHRTTWEANPNIKQEDLVDAFIQDPIGAARDFGANPPGSLNPFIEDDRIVDMCIDKNRQNSITIKERFFDTVVENHVFNYISADVVNVRYNNLIRYVMHCDPGKNKDSFCIAIGYLDNDVVIIDGAIELRPIPKGNNQKLIPRSIHFPSILNIILELNKKLRFKFITYDRWNSADQIDALRMAGIPAISKNIDRDDHIKFSESIRIQKIKFPNKENEFADSRIERNMPCGKAIIELLALNDDGRKVDHMPNGSNDMIQCYVGVHRILKTPDKLHDKKQFNSFNRNYSTNTTGRVVRLTKFR
jgi:hypothetical protein